MKSCILANERSLAKPLEAEEQIGLVLDGRYDDRNHARVLARIRVGQKLVSQHHRLLLGHAQLLHGEDQRLLAGLSAVGIRVQP